MGDGSGSRGGYRFVLVVGSLVMVALAFLYQVGTAPVMLSTEISIDAPRAEVWKVVRDMQNWKDWNPCFHIEIDGMPEVGSPILIKCHWPDGSKATANERISHVEPETRLCWDYEDLPDWALGTDRCVVLTDTETGGTHVRNYELFFNLLGGLVGNLFGKSIIQGFSLMNEKLKQKVEAAAEEEEEAK